MGNSVAIIGGGLAGSEAALQLATRGITVHLYERRPNEHEPIHKTGLYAELVCSNSLKSEKPESAAGMLKEELHELGSFVLGAAYENRVEAGGALAVNRDEFAQCVTDMIHEQHNIIAIHGEVTHIDNDGRVHYRSSDVQEESLGPYDAIIIATGPLTSDSFAQWLEEKTGSAHLAFYDAAAPIVYADSIDYDKVFRQSRYEDQGRGDYLNAPFDKEQYEAFVAALVTAERVIAKDFETSDLFQACQPVEEIARTGLDSLRHGTMKPVGLTDPATQRRPWAALQLRAEDKWGQSYNLVGCQTNLTFTEQQRVFRMVPGLEHAQFARYGVMHRNTFIDAPRCISHHQMLLNKEVSCPLYVAGQISGTEGYTEAIRSGLHAALNCAAHLLHLDIPKLPLTTAYGALLAYATDCDTKNYQPKHVNFGDMPPLHPPVRNKKERYAAYAARARSDLSAYKQDLISLGLIDA